MASNLRVDTILPSTGTTLGIGTASGTINFLGNSNITTTGTINAASATITGNLGVGGTLTYEDVTNIDSVGLITARSGINVSGGEVKVGTAVTMSSSGVITSGIVTATSFSGSGAGLTGTGKVVGFAFASSSTNEQNTSGNQTWTLVGPQITHTAASTSNKLVFLHTHHLMIEGSMHWRMALWRDGTSGTNVYQMKTYTQLGANWSAVKGIQNVTTTAPDTSSHTYQFAIYRSTGSDGLIRYSPNSESTGSQITMLEIQP